MKQRIQSGFLLSIILIFAVLLFTGCPGGSPVNDTETEIETAETNEELLENLGMTLDDDPAVNGNDEVVTGTMNPLGGVINELTKVYEIAQIGADIDGLGPYSLSDHSGKTNTGFSVKAGFSGDEAWMDYPKKSLAADIDSDGKDNVITAVFNASADGSVKEIYFQVQQADGSFVKHRITDGDGNEISFEFMDDFGSRAWLTDKYLMRDFTTGDFDGDRMPDFVVSCKTGVVIFNHEFNLIGSLSLPDKGEDNYPYVRVEAGDLNNDHYDDLVVVNGCLKVKDQGETGDIHILKGSADGLGVTDVDGDILDYSEMNHVMDGDYELASAEVVIFDSDHDGYAELAIAGPHAHFGGSDDIWGSFYAKYNLYLIFIDPYNEISGNFQYSHQNADGNIVADKGMGTITSDGGYHPRNVAVPRMVAGHFDPEERDMVNVLDLIYYINDSGEWEAFDQFVYTSHDTSEYHQMGYDTAVAGDVTGNGLDELIYLTWSDLPWENAAGSHYLTSNTMNTMNIWGVDKDSGDYAKLETINCSSSNEFPTLALANVDDDSIVLEYLGHTLNYAEPKILAVMASPPYDADLGDQMDLGESGTSYSISSSEGSGSTVNWGFHVDVLVGLELETPEGSTGLEISGAVTNSWDWSWGQMYTKSTTLTYNTDAGMDKVIFAGVALDTYNYRVLSYGEGMGEGDREYSDPGETITINVPRTPQTSSVELSFYNELVSEDARIPDDIIEHTIGDPYSYYSLTEKTTFAENATTLGQTWLFSNGTMDLSQGSGTNEISTATDVVSTTTFDYDLGVDVELKIKVGYAVGGYGIGAHVGYGYTYEVSEGIEVSGAVGVIPDPTVWTENNFNWGLMMIPRSFEDQAFNLVTYWVE